MKDKKKSSFLETEKIASDYLEKKIWEVRENANIQYSWSGLLLHVAGKVIANYTLDKVYTPEIARAHRSGDFHLHNLYMGIIGYCAGWDLQKLLLEGFNLPGKVSSKPARHLDAALLQVANFVGTIQNEWAGAQAFNSIDTFLAPFVRRDKLTYKEIKQAIQKFIFNMNISSRWGGQSPFTNITLDWCIPKDIARQPVVFGGKTLNETYAGYQSEVDSINRAFLEVMQEGDMSGRPFTFPIPTYNLTKDFDWGSNNARLLFEMTSKYGLPYFSNFVNSDLNPEDIRSMCCHLRLDLRKLQRNITGGLFGSANSTGSIGVVTINMPRLGYLAKNDGDFFSRLDKSMDLTAQSLEIKRRVVDKNMKSGLLPYTKRYLGTLENHFSTIGLVGMNEACLNFLGQDIASQEGKVFAIKTLKFMLKKLQAIQQRTGNLYNLEATPAESTSYRLALKDKKIWPRIKSAGKATPYYTNSTWLPVNKKIDLFSALKHQEALQTLYTGGTVFHTYLGEQPDPESCKALVKKMVYKTKLPYITITPTYSICPSHGYLVGEHAKCPKCGKRAEIYSRVVGYFRPVQNWNVGKREEFKQRKMYKV